MLDLARELRAGRCSASEVVRQQLERLESLAKVIGGVAAVDPERTLDEARAADRRLHTGQAGALEGVPFTVKDWIDAAGWPIAGATGGDAGDAHRRPDADASAVSRLRDAGAIVLAITTALADNPLHGAVRNPYDLTRAPGGSSSGAAALLAAGGPPLALCSDSGGSIRLPAAWCGVVGLKPSFGRVPLTGHYPRCGALEDGRTVIGPMTRAVGDAAAALALIAGPDGLDAGVAPVPLGDPDAVDLAAMRFAVMGNGHTADAASALSAAGAREVEDNLPDVLDEVLEVTRRYWRRGEGSGEEYLRLMWDWDRFRRRMLVATTNVDVILAPATEGPPPPWRETIDTDFRWTLPWSLTGAPVVVLPVGMADGLPEAIQIIARPWRDEVALAAARCVEASLPRVPLAEPAAGGGRALPE